MDLHLTWDGLQGPNINYVIEYRVSGTTSWVLAASNIHVNYYDILGIADNFYDIKVSTYCNNSIVEIQQLSAGKSACSLPEFIGYSIIEDTVTYQKINITFDNAGPSVKLRVKRLNDNTYVLQESTTSSGIISVTLLKSPTTNNTYVIEIANSCTETDSEYVSMGQYSVQKMPNAIPITFIDQCNCDNNTPVLTFFRQDTTGTYINPLGIPRGMYNINVQIPAGSCSTSKLLTLAVKILQGTTEVLTDSTTVAQGGGVYVLPFSGIDAKSGIYTGRFSTEIKFELTC